MCPSPQELQKPSQTLLGLPKTFTSILLLTKCLTCYLYFNFSNTTIKTRIAVNALAMVIGRLPK